jgi:serine/threonine protein kinase
VNDERAGTRPHRDDPVNQHEPERTPEDPREEAAAADPRTTIAGRYAVDLQSPPVETGIVVAYQGRDLRTRDPVVVKTLRLEYRTDPQLRARFRREARLLQFLSHPNVVRALSYSEERGAPWLVLENIRGRALRETITRTAPLAPEAVAPLLEGLAAGLDHLHARGLVHLDVRPDNVVITPEGEVKLVDFGVAQSAGTAQNTSDGAATAGLAYLAPEQTRGEPVSTATDVYALGSIVYELLTGATPFAKADDQGQPNATVRARLEGRVVPPSTARGDGTLPAWVDDIVLGALERDPRQRYGSAGSFAAMFRSALEGEVDVETGRPRSQPLPARNRQIPVNEPGIAVKGSPGLASRRGNTDPAAHPVASRRAPGLDPVSVGRWLWRAVLLAAALNLLLIGVLVATRGEVPGVWRSSSAPGPGVSVRIAGTGLVARAAPEAGAPIVADLPEGGTVRISGEAVEGSGGLWWPIEVETGAGTVRGYVPMSWVQAP